MKKDITDSNDIKRLVNAFYDSVRISPLIGPVFTEIAVVDWDHHLPRMYAFWAALLLDEQGFSGNPMQKHIALSRQTPMTEVEFTEWLRLFNQAVDGQFQGEKAELAKEKAANIAKLMLQKIQTL